MDRVTFTVNGIDHSVGCEVSSTTTLLDYLRRTLELRGTKYMCLEAGCGACIVSAAKCHGDTPQGVNSCMVQITSCHGWEIETIEKVGNRLEGYHPLQTTLAKEGGSQCGYCSPGMVMNMYSYLKAMPRTMLEIERALGSNVCRCTGYRPILEAFKKFGKDAPNAKDITDIEDLHICKKSGEVCNEQKCEHSDWCFVTRKQNELLHIKLSDHRDWYRAETLADVFNIWREKGTESYMLVNGNTGKGVYPILEYPKLLIDISDVSELKGYYIDQNLVLGAGTTLAEVLHIFAALSSSEDFSYLKVLYDHIELVAHVTVRNLATLAGNLMLKNRHLDFKSDIFLLFETVGADVTILTGPQQSKVLTMLEFLQEDMTGKIIQNILLPPLSCENKLVTYKIMPRSQNAHALVHAGFLYQLDDSHTVRESRLVYSGLAATVTRARGTERYLQGRPLFQNATLQGALRTLDRELVFRDDLLDPPVQYKRQVALGLFYKSLLSLCPPHILNPIYCSGAIKLSDVRPVSKSIQVYETDPVVWPVNEPIPKIDGLVQCAGEAKYIDDVPSLPEETFLAFVLAKIPLGTIKHIDSSAALSEPGVIAFYSALDIPGVNSFIPAPNRFNLQNEELFCNGEVKYYDQPIGVIVAVCQSIANKAATLVKVEYTNVKKPVLDIRIAVKDPLRSSLFINNAATEVGPDTQTIIKGEDSIFQQYAFTMETLACVTYPTEEGVKMVSSTQWMDLVQQAASRSLKIDENRIDVYVRRIGGGYGYKLTRSSQMSVASGLAVYKLNKPCRFNNPLEANMRAVGKRLPCYRKFEVGVNSRGKIQYVNNELYSDNGYVYNEPLMQFGVDIYYNCYRKELWNHKGYNSVTDTASNSWCRSPGTLEAVAMAEIMIERIAYELNLDPLEVRLENVDREKYSALVEMTQTIIDKSQYNERKCEVDKFNSCNRWKKRGLRFSYLRWPSNGYQNYEVNLSVYSDDGTVVITHGGIEMGQGINTKAIQICAYFLKIPVDKIQIKPNDTVITPNSNGTGASITSQNVGVGVRRCCEQLLARLEPTRRKLQNPTWVELIKQAYQDQVDLQTHYYTGPADAQTYDVYGVLLSEIEIDVLTGEHQFLRVDLIEDVGRSINPEVDLGQIEGAFIMGVGYWTCENFVYHPDTGEVLTNRTWEYWVPQALDIPQDFRVYFRRRSFSTEVILGAKATGEPATCLAVGVAFALREAIASARMDSGIPTTQWFQIDGPYTVDKICVACATKPTDFMFN